MNILTNSQVYIRVSRDNGAIGYHIPAWIKEIHDNDTVTVTFKMYGNNEEIVLTKKELCDVAEEILLGHKEY